ncbi:glycosyltransferase [Parvibaculum sp.]|uniref:glycosyltransferase n=1 Tax=Parvibaculum sp. TaxID=2024848 RepID=UPI00320EB99D
MARILYVINGFDPGGAEHGLLMLIRNGFFAGHELAVMGFCHGRGALAEEIAAALGASRLEIVTPGKVLTLRGCYRGAIALWQALRRQRPDLVVLSLKQANVVGRAVLCAFPGIRCISFEHIARYRARRAERIYRYLLWLLSFRVDEIWADCQETLRETRRYFIPRRRRETVVPLFQADAKVEKTDYEIAGPIRIAGAGRLVDRKNFDVLIDAVSRLRGEGMDTRLDIFGDGPEEAALARKIDAEGLAEAVRLRGYRGDWLAQAAGCDVFVNMSDTEGFCIVVAEALSVGLPVIATNVGGIRDYGVDGLNMLKLPAVESSLLVSAIRQLVADKALRRRLGERGRVDMRRDYSAEAIASCGGSVLGEA